MGSIRVSVALACATASLAAAGLATLPAGASIQQSSIVSANPANVTPHVTNGRVLAVAQVGNTIILGGTFTQVTNAGGTLTYTRNRLVAFDATTGVISTTFNPAPNDGVEALAPAADGTSVYVAGRFGTIAGGSASRVARLDVTTGARVPGFTTGSISAVVRDMKRVGNTLYISGRFARVSGQDRGRMASLDATTGALTTKLNLPFTGVNHGGQHLGQQVRGHPRRDSSRGDGQLQHGGRPAAKPGRDDRHQRGDVDPGVLGDQRVPRRVCGAPSTPTSETWTSLLMGPTSSSARRVPTAGRTATATRSPAGRPPARVGASWRPGSTTPVVTRRTPSPRPGRRSTPVATCAG